MPDFIGWTRREPARSFDLHAAGVYQHLMDEYGGTNPKVLGSVLSHAVKGLRARGVLVEYRYIDADYRSEHSRFYSTTFRRYPSIAHRLHFFEKLLDPKVIADTSESVDFSEYGYLGYTVIRPIDSSPVGRTMLRPSKALEGHISCTAEAEVNLFGAELTVEAAPFVAQDSQLSVCIHVSAWVCAYYHHLRFGAPRLLAADIAGFTPIDRDRLVPSAALSVTQLVHLLNEAGLPPVSYDLLDLPGDETPASLACRYLDSGLPVIVAAGGHSFVLVGYRWVEGRNGRRRVQFIRQDDQAGPYQAMENTITFDDYAPWRHLVIPLPEKVYMSGEGAEKLGRTKIEEALAEADQDDLLAEIRADDSPLGYKTSVHLSNDFKTAMRARPADIAAAYHWMQLPRWVWVVELVRLDAWHNNGNSVVAEAVVDATGHASDERVLAWRIAGGVGWTVPDFDPDFPKWHVVADSPDQPPLAVTDTTVVDLSNG